MNSIACRCVLKNINATTIVRSIKMEKNVFFRLGIFRSIFLSLLFFNTKIQFFFFFCLVFYCFFLFLVDCFRSIVYLFVCVFIIILFLLLLWVFLLLYRFDVWWLAVKLKWTSTRHNRVYYKQRQRHIHSHTHHCGYLFLWVNIFNKRGWTEIEQE